MTERLSRAAFTQDLLRLLPTEREEASTSAFLSTQVGLRLLRSCAVGTKILSMRQDLLRSLPLPEMTTAERELIDARILAAAGASESAARAEDEAVRIIEEEVLPQWLA